MQKIKKQALRFKASLKISLARLTGYEFLIRNNLLYMRFASDEELEIVMNFLHEAGRVALRSTCGRSRCGSVIVKDGNIIGTGFNSPPGNKESQKRCHLEKDSYNKKVTDKTCCVHAEQRAIMDALSRNPDKLAGSRLYFTRIDEDGSLKFSGQPYCTICSKMSLDAGIAEFILNHKEGIGIYDTEEYNDLSYKYS